MAEIRRFIPCVAEYVYRVRNSAENEFGVLREAFGDFPREIYVPNHLAAKLVTKRIDLDEFVVKVIVVEALYSHVFRKQVSSQDVNCLPGLA